MEKQIDIFNLIFIRRSAELEVRKRKEEQKQKSWWEKFHNWWSQNSDKDNSGRLILLKLIFFSYSLDSDLENIMTMDEKKKLYDAIGYEDDQKPSIYPEEVNLIIILFQQSIFSIL